LPEPLSLASFFEIMTPEVSRKYSLLRQFFINKAKVAVAFSGGVDSSLVLYTAVKTVGRTEVVAVHAKLAFQGAEEFFEVQRTADHLGCRLLVLPINPLDWPEFVENPVNRCYICKNAIFRAFREELDKESIAQLMDGTNADDLQQFRPGLKALSEHGVVSPLAEVGLGKEEIRSLSHSFSLPSWNKPAASCLATRIDQDQEITAEKLAIVAAIEKFLQERGYPGCRARLSSGRLLVELQQGDNVRFFGNKDRQELLGYGKQWGISKVYLDILGRG